MTRTFRKNFMTLFPAGLVLVGILFEYTGIDIWWTSHFYDFNSGTWPYRSHWLFDSIIHEGGRYFNICVGVAWLICFVLTFLIGPARKLKKPMLYFLSATAAGPLIVGALKNTTHIYTPWDLKIFSGTMPYIRLFDHVPNGLPVGEGFPAGHASGGYAFFSLYFVLRHFGSPYRIYGLLFGLGLGTIFGIGQQVRGAHFPSHDLFSMAICWYAALIFYFIFYPKEWKGYYHGNEYF